MPLKKSAKKAKSKTGSRKRTTKAPAKRASKAGTKKATRKVVASSKATPKNAAPKPIGKVTHFFREIKVAVVKFSKPVKKGAKVRFVGATTDFAQKLDSMQYDHKAVATAPKGKEVGVKIKKRVRDGDKVYPEK